MSHRYGQEDKFKNITLKLEQVPQMHASTIVRASPADREHYRPSTPISNSKYITETNRFVTEASNVNIEIRTSHLPAHTRAHSITSSPSHLHPQDDLRQSDEEELRRQLQEKEEIISELKNIIKLSNQNNSRVKPKSIYQGEKSPDKQDADLKELRHNVKVLTVENNALSGYIDKLKQQLAEKNNEEQSRLRQGGVFEKEHDDLALLDELRQENERLRELVQEKDSIYERKFDEFIASQKSLANECKRLQHLKQTAEAENQRLSLMLRDLQETQRRSHTREEDKLGKTLGSERLSIVKIKEQYAESIRQMRETIHIEVENLFDNFRQSLTEIDKRVSFLERRIRKIEEELRRPDLDLSRNLTKKSEIYIQEGSESLASEGSARRNNLKSVAVSRFYEEVHKTNEEELLRPLQQEIGRLKEIIADMENQMSARSDYYTFREQDSNNSAEREKELLHQVNRLKEEIDRLENAYRQEKTALQDEMQARQEKIGELSSAMQDIHGKYQQSLEKMKDLVSIKRAHHELQEELSLLKQQNAQGARKLEQYRKLCQLLQEESEENTINYQIFNEMKRQICEIKERSQFEQLKYTATEKQNKEILAANQQLKVKLEMTLTSAQKAADEHEQLKQLYQKSQTQKEELIHRANYNQKVIQILEGEIRAKKEIEMTLMGEKNALEKQLIAYLSLFNKLTFEEKSARRGDQLPIEDLLSKLSKLQASFSGLYSSKREIISRMMESESMEGIELSSIKRKEH